MSAEEEAASNPAPEPVRRLVSSHSTGMESSVLRVKDVNFTVGKGDKTKTILQDINFKLKWGHVLALMGPSGAGKTVLISALTLDALFGKATGSVTLNGEAMTDEIFKQHAYVVEQKDKLWPYLTCRETLRYAGELYNIADTAADTDAAVAQIITKLGLDICADTRNSGLSGGQQRRLSLGLALLKSPTLLFLDEPTTGLDSAAAEKIMQEIVSMAKAENLIIICTIHQPSSKVYQGFDQVMILSKGREAYTGDVKNGEEYFESIGYPLPLQTNPAEHFLDLVNPDFSDEAEVNKILDTWQEMRPDKNNSSHHKKKEEDDEGQEGVTKFKRVTFATELSILFRRQGTLIVRDPILYLGRCVMFLVVNLVFAFVFLSCRDYTQDQAVNKAWVNIWYMGVPSNMGVVAVYVLNEEFKAVRREVKNGMISPLAYVVAKSVLVLPIMILFSLFALVIPHFLISDFPWDTFVLAILIYSVCIFEYECLAEVLSVWFDDPILGMLMLLNFWFGGFLFGGFLIPLDDMYWPFEAFYYIMPFGYFLRAFMYNALEGTTWETCTDQASSQVCIWENGEPVVNPSGGQVLEGMSRIVYVVENENNLARDAFVLLGCALFFKCVYVAGILMKSNQASKIYAK